jgi:hypothetical protein
VKSARDDCRRLERRGGAIDQSGGQHAGIGDDEGSRKSERLGQLTDKG